MIKIIKNVVNAAKIINDVTETLSSAVSKVETVIPIQDNSVESKKNSEKILKIKSDAGKYMIGYGVEKDILKAFELYKQAAEAGDVDSMNIVGNMYYNCEEIFLQDSENALKWYLKAAQAGHKDAMLNLANMYFKGEGTKKKIAEAVKWYTKAFDCGVVEAANILGNIYYDGKGIKQDRHEAFKWFRKSADAGNAEGIRNLGMMYFNEGGTNNLQQALNYFRKSAELNNVDAMADIAFMYQNGYFVKKDTDKAHHWLKKSAEGGSANGMFNYGMLLSSQKNYSDAIGWLIAAYDKSEGVAAGQIAYNISLIYKKIAEDKSDWLTNIMGNDNGEQERRKAAEWLNISKELKYEPPTQKNNKSDDGIGVFDIITLTVYGIGWLISSDD